MKLFYSQVKDSVRYALSDRNSIIFIGILAVIISIVSKIPDPHMPLRVLRVLIFFIVGYGSFISYYTLKGEDKHPSLRHYKRIFWEGFKKSLIIAIYSIGLMFFKYHAENYFAVGNIILAAACVILFVLNYILMIGGLFNRYLNWGTVIKAFDIPEIIRLMRVFDLASFIKVLIAVIIAKVFVILIVISFGEGMFPIEMIFSLSTFFLAPFLFLATKRLVGLNVYVLLENANLLRE